MTEQIMQIVERLQKEVAAGTIWNQDFIQIKDALNSKFEKEIRLIQESCLQYEVNGQRAKSYEYPGVNELYWQLNSSLYQINANIKALAKNRKCLPGHLCTEMEVLIETWQPIWSLLYTQAKPLIVKGRRPSETVSDHEKRTLENTGTCPVCGKNVKREDDGTLTLHGYQVEGHEFHGRCHGVGYQPWEVSSEGAVSYREGLSYAVGNIRLEIIHAQEYGYDKLFYARKRVWVSRNESGYQQALESRVRELESRFAQLTSELLYYGEKIINWAPAELPGVLAGFSK